MLNLRYINFHIYNFYHKILDKELLLQYAVSSLQWKFDEAQKLFEERSKQAMDAESMVIELKTSMQRLHHRFKFLALKSFSVIQG